MIVPKILVKSKLGRKDFISVYSVQIFMKSIQGRNLNWDLEAEIQTETMEEQHSLVCFSWFLIWLFNITWAEMELPNPVASQISLIKKILFLLTYR